MTLRKLSDEINEKYCPKVMLEQTPEQLIAGLREVYDLIDDDLEAIKEQIEKHTNDLVQTYLGEETKIQARKSIKREQILERFCFRLSRSLEKLISSLAILLQQNSKLDLFPIIEKEYRTILSDIQKERDDLKIHGLYLDTAQLYSLARLKKLIFAQLDALSKTPTDAASILKVRDENEAKRKALNEVIPTPPGAEATNVVQPVPVLPAPQVVSKPTSATNERPTVRPPAMPR